MLHIALHALVPLLVAWLFFRPRWRRSAFLLLVGVVVDVDHLLASPIYDPERCSLGFHPLHTAPAVTVYVAAAGVAVALIVRGSAGQKRAARTAGMVALGLLIHMVLDWGDCII